MTINGLTIYSCHKYLSFNIKHFLLLNTFSCWYNYQLHSLYICERKEILMCSLKITFLEKKSHDQLKKFWMATWWHKNPALQTRISGSSIHKVLHPFSCRTGCSGFCWDPAWHWIAGYHWMCRLLLGSLHRAAFTGNQMTFQNYWCQI